MRIVFVTRAYSVTGGIARHVRDLARELEARGSKVLVLHDDPGATSEAGEKIERIVGLADEWPFSPRSTARGALEAAVAFGADVVHVQECDDHATEVALRGRFPATKTLHVYDACPAGSLYQRRLHRECPTGPGLHCWVDTTTKGCIASRRPWVHLRMLARATAARSHLTGYRKLVTASEAVARHIRSSTGAEVAVVPNFTRAFENAPPPAGERRGLAYVGRLVPDKGAHVLLDALARLPGAIELDVLGEGGDRPRLEERARSLGIAARVRFRGWASAEEVLTVLSRTAVLALPSLWPEPFGIVGIEALAACAGVVASRVGGVDQWFDARFGELVPPGDAALLADAIARVHERVAREGGLPLAHAYVREKFSADAHLAKLLPLYEELVKAGPTP
ncbi:glycosyltransferase [bacterium]|nr:glycosyltransferase [bacterium]